jgi:O-antigen/teichoic acid export membrane protein
MVTVLERLTLLRVLRNSGWLVAERLVRVITAILINVWIARLLGPSEFGTLAYVLAVVSFLQSAVPLGLDSIIVRELKRGRYSAQELLGTVLAGRLIAGVLGWASAVVASLAIAEGDSRIPLLVALAGVTTVFQAGDVVDLWFQSQTRSRDTVRLKLVAFALVTGIKLLLLTTAAPLSWFVAVVGFEGAAIAAALGTAYRRYWTEAPWSIHWPLMRPLLRESWPLIISSIAVVAYMRADQLLIRAVLGDQALGIYAAAMTVSQALHFVPALIAVSLAPFVVEAAGASAGEMRRRFVWIFRVYFYAGLLLAVLISIAARPLVECLYGDSFSDAAAVLRIHVFTNVFICLGVAHSLWLTYRQETGVRLVGTLAAACLALGANAALLPGAGLTGVAVIAVLAQFVAAVGINALMSRESFRLQLEAIFFVRLH